jgi:hypothetical protein
MNKKIGMGQSARSFQIAKSDSILATMNNPRSTKNVLAGYCTVRHRGLKSPIVVQ